MVCRTLPQSGRRRKSPGLHAQAPGRTETYKTRTLVGLCPPPLRASGRGPEGKTVQDGLGIAP
jgi:hypothetical protein